MAGRKETALQTVLRHLRNGYIILTDRGTVALFGASMREVAKLIDSPVGVFLPLRDIFTDGPNMLRTYGLRTTMGAFFRQLAAQYDPPLGRSRNPVNTIAHASAIRYHDTYELTKLDGVIPARRPVNDMDFALEVPFAFPPSTDPRPPIAALIHAFYPEELESALSRLRNIPGTVDLFISTDSAEKQQQIGIATASWNKGATQIRILPNRGRDMGAKFIGFRDVYERYELFIALHIKKSPHGGAPLARWRDYLFDTLLGSPQITASILQLFEDPKLGIVFPQHLFEIRGILNWGYDYDLARGLMRRMGIEIDKNLVLEFPSGSMFWGRSAALQPLLDLDLAYEDFPEESGQVDGTLAHALERIILMASESHGFEWLKVARRDLYPISNTVLSVTDPQDLPRHRLKVFQPCLTAAEMELPPNGRYVQETRAIAIYPSRSQRARLNLIVPTVNPQQTFGGIATALKLFEDWADHLECDRRIISTDAEIEPEGYAALSSYQAVPFAASFDEAPRVLVDAKERSGGRLDLREREVFIATAWWTVDIIRKLEADRQRHFGGHRPFVYIIQDDEPYFNNWSSRFALAESSYHQGEDIIAVINSEELFTVMTQKYSFHHSFCLPYQINAHISARLDPRPRERNILIYGRPTVARNAFEIIYEALKIWQQRDPIRASLWRIVFLGEEFEPALAYPVQNISVEGKVSLDAYADHLNRAAIGVSLMISPHPSYPPLEMAEAGLLTITNAYPGKDLKRRFPDIVSLEDLHPQTLALALEAAVEQMEAKIGAKTPRRHQIVQPVPGRLTEPATLAALLKDYLQ